MVFPYEQNALFYRSFSCSIWSSTTARTEGLWCHRDWLNHKNL